MTKNIFKLLTMNRSTSIGTGIVFALLLLVVSIGLTPLFDTDLDYVDVDDDYDWDFSSGLELSNSFNEYRHNLFLFSTLTTEITDFQRHADGWSGSSVAIAYYGYDVFQLDIWLNTEKNFWRSEIYYTRDGDESKVQEWDHIPLGEVSDTFISEVAVVSNLTKVNIEHYNSFFANSYEVGDIKIDIRFAFQDGTFFDVMFLGGAILIQVSYFSGFYGDDGVSFRDNNDGYYDNYIGYIDFPTNYTDSVTKLLENMGA